jgi:hypothetical protein
LQSGVRVVEEQFFFGQPELGSKLSRKGVFSDAFDLRFVGGGK